MTNQESELRSAINEYGSACWEEGNRGPTPRLERAVAALFRKSPEGDEVSQSCERLRVPVPSFTDSNDPPPDPYETIRGRAAPPVRLWRGIVRRLTGGEA